jgi:esterase/lipase
LLPTETWQAIGDRLLVFSRILENPYPNDLRDPAEKSPPGRIRFNHRNVQHQLSRLIAHNRGRASELKAPLLMILSREDLVVDWQAAEGFFKDCSHPQNRILFLPATGHAMMRDYVWPDIVAAIREFAGETVRQEAAGNG